MSAATIQAAIDAIDAKLAQLAIDGIGLLPKTSGGGGEEIDHGEYLARLTTQREKLMQLLPMADGPWEYGG